MSTTVDTIKNIRIHQNSDGYRFSMDAILLADFVDLQFSKTIADLGAGTGIIGLLLAKKYPQASVTLMELQDELYKLALRNIDENSLVSQVRCIQVDIRDIDYNNLSGFDLIVSNPPFRKPVSGKLSQGKERAIARHEIELTLHELLTSASRLLRARGRFYMIYHPERLSEVMDFMRKVNLEPKRLRFIHGRQGSEARMVLIEAVRDGNVALKVEPPMFVYNGDVGQDYSDEVRAIYED